MDLENYIRNLTSCPDSKKSELQLAMRNFKKSFKLKWDKCGKHKNRFFVSEKTWLENVTQFKFYQKSAGGRPIKPFDDCSDQSKRRKTAELRHNHSTEELTYAAQMSLRASGKRNEAKKVQELVSPNTSFERSVPECRKLTNEQALSLMMEAQLSRRQYNIVRNYAKDVFPSYKNVCTAKKLCLPDGIRTTEVESEVPLQSLLDHTANRLMLMQKEVVTNTSRIQNISLISKWGFDGSSSHTQYMQKFASETSDDKYIFLSSLVPLRLIAENEYSETIVLWQNPRPSSPRFCRPIKLQYEKESVELTKKEKLNIDNQINSLINTTVMIDEKEYSITHSPLFTMIDGKICNSLTDTKSTLRCYLCDATSKEFNDLTAILEKPVKSEYLSFGISVLHAWIRLFECLLHLAYKLPTQTWRINKETEKIVEENKKRIQSEFRKHLSLIVDKPKPGYGNTNDGNVARKFFQNSQLSATITGIDQTLIQKLYIILQTISSGFKIDTSKFKSFCLNTAELYVTLYPWYPMTTTLHKILIHGDEIISNCLLPIGQLSEEAQESRNKDFKIYRERFSRKTSRQSNLVDIFHRLLISSDPVITNLRPLQVVKRKPFDPEVTDMLLEELVTFSNQSGGSDDEI